MTTRARYWSCALALVWLSGALGLVRVATQSSAPVVYSAEVESIIHPVSAEFMIEAMEQADEASAALVVFTLRTPGGLVDSTRDIVTRMLAAKTPVAVFVGPSGARAASAGFVLTIAADVAAMAPGTHIGAAHPVSGGGEQMDETVSQKAASDMAAYVRTLASGRRRNVALSEEAVNDSRAFTDREALDADPPLIDLSATDLSDLLLQLDGRTISRFDGTTTELRTANAEIVHLEMSIRQRVLSSIANPNIAYLLLSLGMLGLTIELWSPGAVFPGVVGGVSLVLAFFALQMLPVNYAGVLLLMLGFLMLILEIKVISFGLLTVGGIISLVLGSMMLIDSPVPELQLNFGLVLPMLGAFIAIAIFLIRLAVAAQRQAAFTGEKGMLRQVGTALTAINPGQVGQVSAHGEIWNARSDEPISEHSRVHVVGVDGLTLIVRNE
jgi:membrane-bound serine protease (ClpP class)